MDPYGPSPTDDDNPFGAPPSVDPADLEYLLTPEPEISVSPLDVVGRTLHLLATRPLALLGLIVASTAVHWALTLVGAKISGTFSLGLTGPVASKASGGISMGLTLLVAWAASTIVQSPIVGAAIEARTGQRGLIGRFLQRAVRRAPALLGSVLVTLVATMVLCVVAIGAVALLVQVSSLLPHRYLSILMVVSGSGMAAYYLIRSLAGLSLVAPIVLVEGDGVIAALRRSWTLTAGHRYAIVWGVLLPLIAFYGSSWLLGSLVPAAVPWFALCGAIFMLLYMTAMAPATYVVFREHVEGTAPANLVPRRAR